MGSAGVGRVTRLGRLISLLALVFGGAVPASAQANDLSLDSIAARIGAWTRTVMDTSGIPAISIAVVRGKEVAWVGAYGYANAAVRVPATPDTYFNTGSTFKSITATAVMQLAERGLLTLDTPLNEIIGPEYAIPGADDVTLRHLLSHHSGLDGPVDRVALWSRDIPLTIEETLTRTSRVGPPGVEYRYCNVCYGALEYVIEKVSGQAYDEYVAANILQPLGVEVTSASVPSPRVVERMAVPYQVTGGVPTAVDRVRYNTFAAGDAYLRPTDMARFLVTQLTGGVYHGTRILTEASVAEMQRVQFGDSNNGLGLVVRELSGHTVILHGGTVPGFKAVLMGDPMSGSGIYIMSNAAQAERPINLLAWYVMMMLWGEEVSPPGV